MRQVYEDRFSARSNNRQSRYREIGYKARIKRWVARATVNGKRHNVGCYLTEEDAFEARKAFLTQAGAFC